MASKSSLRGNSADARLNEASFVHDFEKSLSVYRGGHQFADVAEGDATFGCGKESRSRDDKASIGECDSLSLE